jgi:hypothetical protein
MHHPVLRSGLRPVTRAFRPEPDDTGNRLNSRACAPEQRRCDRARIPPRFLGEHPRARVRRHLRHDRPDVSIGAPRTRSRRARGDRFATELVRQDAYAARADSLRYTSLNTRDSGHAQDKSRRKAQEVGDLHRQPLDFYGSPTWARTRDLRINSSAFYTFILSQEVPQPYSNQQLISIFCPEACRRVSDDLATNGNERHGFGPKNGFTYG